MVRQIYDNSAEALAYRNVEREAADARKRVAEVTLEVVVAGSNFKSAAEKLSEALNKLDRVKKWAKVKIAAREKQLEKEMSNKNDA